MFTAAGPTVDLICHPAVASPGSLSIRVDYACAADNILRLRYSLHGALSRLLVPEVRAAERTAELWRHTCFEAFVGSAGTPVYCEFNFAPSRQWAVYRFASYRAGMDPVGGIPAPTIGVRRELERLEIDVTCSLAEISELPGDARLKLALAAVIESEDGTLSYWALRHPRAEPDFHHSDSFAISLR